MAKHCFSRQTLWGGKGSSTWETIVSPAQDGEDWVGLFVVTLSLKCF